MKRSTASKTGIVSEVASAILHVNDLKASTAWYADILNMPLESIDNETPFYVFDMDNRVNLILDDHRNSTYASHHPICMFRTDDIDNAYLRVQQSGIAIALEKQEPHPGLSYFNIVDSEGNVIMIGQSDWVNPNPVQPLESSHPIKNHLHNVVIPVNHVKRASEWYSKLFGQTIHPERLDGGPICWFDMENGTGILLDDNRNNQDLKAFPTFMLKTDNVAQAFKLMQDKGVKIVRDIQFNQYFIIEDHEGNTIIVCLATDQAA